MQVLILASLLLLQVSIPESDRIKEKGFLPTPFMPTKNNHKSHMNDNFCYVKKNEVSYFGGACIYCKKGWDKKTCLECGVLYHEKKVENLFHYDYSIKYIWNYGQ